MASIYTSAVNQFPEESGKGSAEAEVGRLLLALRALLEPGAEEIWCVLTEDAAP